MTVEDDAKDDVVEDGIVKDGVVEDDVMVDDDIEPQINESDPETGEA